MWRSGVNGRRAAVDGGYVPLEAYHTQCYIHASMDAEQTARAFKTAWFTKAARKARIKDDELCDAIEEVRRGQADDLGGGVFKKRLNKNRHRSIILAKGGRYWIYQFLFAKKTKPTSTMRTCKTSEPSQRNMRR